LDFLVQDLEFMVYGLWFGSIDHEGKKLNIGQSKRKKSTQA